MNMENITKELQAVEHAIKKSEELRQQAITKKGFYETALKETDDELKKLGTTAEAGRLELEKIDKEIEKNLEDIKSMIPYDLLTKYNLIQKQ